MATTDHPIGGSRLGSYLPELSLLGITFIWGASFLIIQTALAVSGPLFFQGFRYAIAAVFLVAISARHMRGLTALEVKIGLLTAAMVAIANALQAIALAEIPSSKSAFLTALYVPMVPLAQLLIMRVMPRPMAWVGIAMAFAGMALLAGPQALALDFGRGELMTIASAAIIAVEIVLIGVFTHRLDARRVSAVQLLFIALFTFAGMAPMGEAVPDMTWLLLACAGGLGLGSVVIHVAMYWAQRKLSPTRATLIYATEPIWAGIIGRMAGERLPFLALLGAGLIVASIALNAFRRQDRG